MSEINEDPIRDLGRSRMTPQAQPGAPSGTATESIPRADWGRFLDEFTEFNEETAVRVELVGSPEMGSQILVEDRPLLAVTLDDAAGPAQVIIECGDTAGDTPEGFRHVVQDPTALWVRKTDPAGWDALEILTCGEGAIVLTVNPYPGRGDLGLKEVGRSETRVP